MRCSKVVSNLRYTGHQINIFVATAGHAGQRQRTDPHRAPALLANPSNLCAEVLVELGRYEEGKALLASLTPSGQDPFDTFMSRAFIAIAEHRLGNAAEARRFADAARGMAGNRLQSSPLCSGGRTRRSRRATRRRRCDAGEKNEN